MAYKEPKLTKDDILAMRNALGSIPERPKAGKGSKPKTVKRLGNTTKKK